MVFHYWRDALLYFVQIPGREYTGAAENAMFYSMLWLMVGIGCAITTLAADRMGVRATDELYAVGETQPATEALSESAKADGAVPASTAF